MRKLFFDFFGVLCPDVAPLVLSRYLSEDEVLHCRASIVQPAELGFISQAEMFERLGAIAHVPPGQLEATFVKHAKIDPFMIALIEELRQEHRVGLLANAYAPFIRKIMAENGLEPKFDAVLVSAEENIGKPHPAFFRMMLKEMAAAPEECITIDARPPHIEGAREIGISGILFETVDGLRTDLAKRFGITVTAPRPYRGVVTTVYNG